MYKKIIVIILLFFLNISIIFAAAWFSERPPKYYLFFKNSITNQEKYTKLNDYLFDYYFNRYINWAEIWWNINIENWKLIKIIENVEDLDNKKEQIRLYEKWKINIWTYSIWLNYSNWEKYDKIDLSKYDRLTFLDLTKKERFLLYLDIFLWFFWIWFLLFIPINIIVFFSLGYFLLKTNVKIFKNVYINSFLIHLITYIIIIYFWLSLQELLSVNYSWFMAYFFTVWFFKLILFIISTYTINIYNKKYDKNFKYKYIIIFYIIVYLVFMLWIKLF